ncbi:hypothetical protein Psta_3457 [Pirellula staleyi DSM 6068]|uniref:Uncharacterized protein n=1 Tax=Pirellula staleyi (strain ATCC 27377 / DSM 6068 / ICPB 4128) TaxID=530564 RepID=D2QYG0_PIRSD|nr:hypothetical protein Psta_3457 [Pirellula staleyi DSM 6068]
MVGVDQVNRFHSTFRSFGNQGVDPIEWERHFLNYHVSEWLSEGDGVLQFFSHDGKRYSLVLVHVPSRGFVLQYDCRDLSLQKTVSCKYAVSDQSQLSCFEEVADGLIYPTGCILPPSTAWVAVKGFLIHPTLPSNDVEWIADQDIPWPESQRES